MHRQPRVGRPQGQAHRQPVADHGAALAQFLQRSSAAVAERRPGATVPSAARVEYHCPACGAEAHWNPARQALVCAYCGTESPATLETAGDGDGRRRARPRGRPAQPARLGPGLAGGEDLGPLPELPGDLGVRRRPGRPALRLLRLGRARPARGGEGRLPAGVAAAVRGRRAPGPGRPAGLVPRPVVRPRPLRRPGSHRHAQRRLRPLLDVRREGRRDLDRGGGPHLHGRGEREAGAAGPVDAGLGVAVPRLRRRARVRLAGRRPRPAPRRRALPHGHPRALRPRLPRGMGRRALPDRPRGRRGALPARDGRAAARAVRTAGARRHPPQPPGARELPRPDLQAHPGSAVARDLHAPRPDLPGRGQRRDRQGRPALDPGAGPRSPSPSLSPCWPSTW